MLNLKKGKSKRLLMLGEIMQNNGQRKKYISLTSYKLLETFSCVDSLFPPSLPLKKTNFFF